MSNNLRKTVPFAAIKLSIADVQTIYNRLSAQVAEQANIEIGAAVKLPNQTDADFDGFKLKAPGAFKVTTTITGPDNSLYGEDASVFTSPNKPEKIERIFMTNATAYKAFTGNEPVCVFTLMLDFSKPLLLDHANVLSAPTPNSSILTVSGTREAWVAAVTEAVVGVTEHRKTRRRWLHEGYRYDVGLMVLGFPVALYLCWKSSTLIEKFLGIHSNYLAIGAYLYIFILAIHAYRILFGYTKWAIPVVELTNNNDSAVAHRAVLGALAFAFLVNFIWEWVKPI